MPRRLNAPPLPPSHLLRGGARPPRAAAERVHEAYPDVVFIGVDEDESGEAARSVAQRFGLTFPVIHDENNVLASRFHVNSMPTTVVADATGVVRWVGGEGQTESELRQAVRAAR